VPEIRLGARAFTANFSNWVSISARPVSASTWYAVGKRPIRLRHSSRTTSRRWSPSISSLSRRSVSSPYVFLYWPMIVAASFTSMLPGAPTAEWTGQQLREAFPFDQIRATCCGTAMRFSAMTSEHTCETWASTKCCPRRPALATSIRRASFRSVRENSRSRDRAPGELATRTSLRTPYYHDPERISPWGRPARARPFSRQKSGRCRGAQVGTDTATNDGRLNSAF